MGLHWLLRRSAVALHCVLPESVNRAAAVVRETDGARWGKATKLLRVSPTRNQKGGAAENLRGRGGAPTRFGRFWVVHFTDYSSPSAVH